MFAQQTVELPGSIRTDRTEAAYRQYGSLLIGIARGQFEVPEYEVESLVHDVFVSFHLVAHEIRDPRSWLVGAISNASRSYGRNKRNHNDGLEKVAEPATSERDITLALAVREALGYMQEQCKETLRLHYFEGYSAREMATLLLTTPRYAEKLIHKCLARLREIYLKLPRAAR